VPGHGSRKSVGEALAKWHATPAGQAIRNAYLADSRAAMALAIAKRDRVPVVEHADNEQVEDASKARARKCAETIKAHMDAGDSYDVAASKAFRAENTLGNHEGENSRGIRGNWNSDLQQPVHNPAPIEP